MTYWPSGDRERTTKTNATIERRYFDDQGLPVLRTEQRAGQSPPTSSDADRWHVYTYDRNANRSKDERGTYRSRATRATSSPSGRTPVRGRWPTRGAS